MGIAEILTALGLLGPAIKLIGDHYPQLKSVFAKLLATIEGTPGATPEQIALARQMQDKALDEQLELLKLMVPVAMPPGVNTVSIASPPVSATPTLQTLLDQAAQHPEASADIRAAALRNRLATRPVGARGVGPVGGAPPVVRQPAPHEPKG